MVTFTNKREKKSAITANEEFEKYVIKQRTSTTFNGIEVANFSWYKRLLGFTG